jgi:hypothetical protein
MIFEHVGAEVNYGENILLNRLLPLISIGRSRLTDLNRNRSVYGLLEVNSCLVFHHE